MADKDETKNPFMDKHLKEKNEKNKKLQDFQKQQNSAEDKEKEQEWLQKLQSEDATLNGKASSSKSSKSNFSDLKAAQPKKKHNGLLITGLIFSLLFLISFVYFLISGQKKSANTIHQVQTERVKKEAKYNPEVRKKLDEANGKQYDAGKETNDSQLNKTQTKEQLNKYNSINARSTLIMLKLHDALVNATKTKSAQNYESTLNDLQQEIQANSNILASVNQSGSFKDLYNISKRRTDSISKLITHQQNTKVISLLTSEYNHQAEKSNVDNQKFLSAFKKVLDEHNIQYSVDDEGNFNY